MKFSMPTIRGSHIFRKGSESESSFNGFLNDFYKFFHTPFFRNNADISTPRLNIYEDKNKYHLEAELPGLNQEDIEVSVDGNILCIKGKREQESEENSRDYYTHEFSHNSFIRSVSLPQNIDASDIEAKFKDGILKVEVNKKEESKIKKIEVKS